MSIINKVAISIDDFTQNIFLDDPKSILIWDTCSFLDILRLPYRGGNLYTLKRIIDMKKLIDDCSILSLCSDLTQTEWNEHENRIKYETQKSLELTSLYHKNSVDMINFMFSTTFQTTKLNDKGFTNELEKIGDGILNNSYFLKTDTISDSALWRVAQKRPPASKKQEFKDCAIWETVISIALSIQGSGMKLVYFTVNTDDYIDKSRTPKAPYSIIASEAAAYNIIFELTFEGTYRSII